jgi:hypothetical protein
VVELRDYLKLERAFTKRLVKAWRDKCGPTCTAIEQACSAGEYDKALSLVPDLDLTEVGTEQREWIKFYLRAHCVFGASLAGKDSPGFVSTGWYDTLLNNVTSVLLQYLEYNATTAVQDSARQLIATLKERSVQKASHSYGIAMVEIPSSTPMGVELDRLRSLILNSDLDAAGKDVDGNHVTIRYGLLGGGEEVESYLRSCTPATLVLGKVKVFAATEHSDGACPVVVEIISNDLKDINAGIDGHGEWKERSFKDYVPHATLAYVKESEAEKYRMLLQVIPQSYIATTVTVETKGEQGRKVHVPLEGVGRVYKASPTRIKLTNPGDHAVLLGVTLTASRMVSWGFLQEAYAAGVTTYKLVATLDHRTSAFCLMIHGKEFQVADALKIILRAVNGTSPDDLREIQPWPAQTKDALASYRKMSTSELANLGFLLPPFHPFCRTVPVAVSSSIGDRPEVLEEEEQSIPEQVVTSDTLKELGVRSDEKAVDFWNTCMRISPVVLLALWMGKDHHEVVTQRSTEVLDIDPESGEVLLALRGVKNGAQFNIQVVLDPIMGSLYIDRLDSSAGTNEEQAAMVKDTFKAAITTASSLGLDSIRLNPGEDPVEYGALGFSLDPPEWDRIREEAKRTLPSLALASEDAYLVGTLLDSKDPQAFLALSNLQGGNILRSLLVKVPSMYLDMTDPKLVAATLEALS